MFGQIASITILTTPLLDPHSITFTSVRIFLPQYNPQTSLKTIEDGKRSVQEHSIAKGEEAVVLADGGVVGG